ncbi:MAG: rod-binding protein [Pseudomonadota bacterium]|nr:rod-binding protein [Pseudomonadota bacterium]
MQNGMIQSLGDLATKAGTTAASMTAARDATAPSRLPKGNIDQASQEFEAMFMTQMLQPMFEGLGSDPTFGGGHGEEVMKTFLIQEYGKLAAKSGHLGIAASVKNEMIKAQAAASTASGGPYPSATKQGGLNAPVE